MSAGADTGLVLRATRRFMWVLQALACVVGAGVVVGCRSPAPVDSHVDADRSLASQPIATTPANWPDVYSYADPTAFVTRAYTLDLDVDFPARQLHGTVTLELERLNPRARDLVLDTRDLDITSVATAKSATERFRPTKFRLDPRDDVLGSALHIEMPSQARRVRVQYSTSPEASGLQWLATAQTEGRHWPFLYSQAQSLHARSFVPLQDTPRIRSTYTATLRVPSGLVAVMAAEPDPANRRGDTMFRFSMPQPIPSYLLALAVGDLEFRATGPRTGVWAEPAMLDAAAREFDDAESMLERSEATYGPYRWGRYDLLVLPPSFPYGGMENPRLTFMTPTVIAGDKSLVGVLAHELAHSWSGNLVTNATWRDGWLNEGFTTYFERRIMEAVYGEDRARMEWGIGYHDLTQALAELAPDEQWKGALAPDLGMHRGRGGSSVAYEKGALFLYQLERRCGRAQLDGFLQRWFDTHAFTSVTTPQLVRAIDDDLVAREKCAIDRDFLHRWIDEPALPADAILVTSDAFDRVDAQRREWQAGTRSTAQLQTSAWTVQEWRHFLNGIERPQPTARLLELDRQFHLTGTANAEVAHAWFRLGLASGYPGIESELERYLTHIGRVKLIKPLYTDLVKTPAGKEFAGRVYAEARPGYHPVVQAAIDRIVKAP